MKRLLILVSCILSFAFLFVSCDGEECKHTRLELISASEGTCVSEGNVKYYKCLACGLRFSDPFAQIIIDNIKTERNPDNHTSISKVDRSEPTCIKEGNIEHYICNGCKRTFTDDSLENEIMDVSIPKDGDNHSNAVFVEGKIPDNIHTGITEHYECEACHKAFKDEALTTEMSKEEVIIPKDPSNKVKSFKIACVGDSLTYNAEYKGENYPDYLWGMLHKRLPSDEGYNIFVGNYGVSGSGVTGWILGDYLFDRRYDNLLKYRQSLLIVPDIVLFMIGTNDMTSWNQAKVGFEPMYRNLIKSYQEINPDVLIFIGISPPAEREGYSKKEIAEILNPIQRSVAEDLGLYIVDVSKAFSPMEDHTDYYRYDMLHPSAKGAQVMAETFFNSIIEIVTQ